MKIRRPISFSRRIIQTVSFILLIYGGALCKNIKEIKIYWLPFVKATPGFRVKERLPYLVTPTEDAAVFDFFLPIRSSPYARNTGLFRGSFLYFLSENLTYLTPLREFLPHVVFYLVCIFLLGTFWCGWICPLCFLQDFLAMIRRKLHIPQIRLSNRLRVILNIFAYIQLVLILIIALVIASSFFTWGIRRQLFNLNSQLNPGDYIFPYLTGFNHSPLQIIVTNPLALILKITMLTILFFFLASFFIKTSYCKICPLGALNGLFNKGSLLNIEKDTSKCTYCGNCYLACPMQLDRIYTERIKKNVDRTFCIRCFRCIDICPEAGCLKVKFLNFTIMKSKSR